jgi:paraquat-inducible protein B
MSEKPAEQAPAEAAIPFAEIRSTRRFSVTWLMPALTVLIAGWLVYTTVAARGPTITISFPSAEGLEPEQTRIKYKEVEIGTVRDIAIAENLDGVVVTAELRRGTEQYLTDQTRFWIVRARVSAKEVRDLGTLISGAYIAIDPVLEGRPRFDFVGLERPPAISTSRSGRYFVLSSESLGSLSIGSPVLYRQIEVGQVTDYRLQGDRAGVLIDIFVEAPFYDLVRENSHFWNASGIQVDINTGGVEIKTGSLISVFLGGIAFDSPVAAPMAAAGAGETFQLYPDRKHIKDKHIASSRLVAYFSDSVRGLAPGAPVEFKGIRIGEVEAILPETDLLTGAFRIKTILAIEPQRIAPNATAEQIMRNTFPRLIARGLHAQLASEHLLSDQLYVALDFQEPAPLAAPLADDPYPQIPTSPSTLSQATQSISNVLAKLEQLPAEQIGSELRTTLNSLQETLTAVKTTLNRADNELSPALVDTLEQFRKTTVALQTGFDEDSGLHYSLRELLSELRMTSRSLRTLADTLERKPQSIFFGKDEEAR